MASEKDPGGDKWKKLPKGWTDASRKKFWDSLTSRAPKHKVSQCIKRMDGKVDDPGAFCAALADRVIGKSWRTEAAKERAKKADMKDPFDLILELDQAQPSEEEQLQHEIDSAVAYGAGEAFYALAKSGASVDPAKRNPGAKGLRSSFGGWWPARKEIKPGLKEMAFRELISDHEWKNLQKMGVRSPRDLPKDTPIRIFFDTEYREDKDGVVSRWYTGYGYVTAAGRKKYLSKKDMKSYRDVQDGLRKYLSKVQKEYDAKMSKRGSSSLQTRRDYGNDEMLSVEEVSKLCPPCGEKMKSAGLKGIRKSVLRTAMLKQKLSSQQKKAAGVSLGYLYSEAQKQFSSVVSKDLVAFYKSFSKSVVAVSYGSKGATVSFANPGAGPIWGLYEYSVSYFYPRKKDSLMVEITKDGRKVHTGEIRDVSLMNSEKVAQRIAVMFEKLMPKRQ